MVGKEKELFKVLPREEGIIITLENQSLLLLGELLLKKANHLILRTKSHPAKAQPVRS